MVPRLARDLILDPAAAPTPHQNQDVLAERLGETIGLALANKLSEVNAANLQSNPGPNQLSANQPTQAPAVDTFHRDWLKNVTASHTKFQEDTIRQLISGAVPPLSAVVQPVSPVQPAAKPAHHFCKVEGCDCEETQVDLRSDYPDIKSGDLMKCCGHMLARHQKRALD